MMKKYLLVIICAVAVLQVGCDRFINGLAVDFEIPDHDPILTPYCFINSVDSTIKVVVQQSQGALEEKKESFIENATIELYKNGSLWNTIPYTPADPNTADGLYSIAMNEAFFTEGFGDSYELKVSAPDFETTTGVQVMPKPVVPKSAEFIDNGVVTQSGGFSDLVKVTFDDPADEENYYLIEVAVKTYGFDENGDTIGYQKAWQVGNHANDIQGHSGVILKDDLFNGQEYTVDLQTSVYQASLIYPEQADRLEHTVSVLLYSITKDEYLYQKSLENYKRSQTLQFSEPTLIHTNMSQELGMFSMMSSTTTKFVVD